MAHDKLNLKTTEKLWKLDDESLTTPEHDEMVLWLLNPANMDKLFVNSMVYGGVRFEFGNHDYDHRTQMGYQDRIDILQKCGFYDIFQDVYDRVYFNEYDSCEDLISEGLQLYLLKYPDFWKNLLKDIKLCSMETFIYKSIKSEKPILGYHKYIIGYADIEYVVGADVYTSGDCSRYFVNKDDSKAYYAFERRYLIEVKPHIKSFGATLRQLRTYQEYMWHTGTNLSDRKQIIESKICLFTKDRIFKEAFESQGIKVFLWDDYVKSDAPEIKSGLDKFV